MVVVKSGDRSLLVEFKHLKEEDGFPLPTEKTAVTLFDISAVKQPRYVDREQYPIVAAQVVRRHSTDPQNTVYARWAAYKKALEALPKELRCNIFDFMKSYSTQVRTPKGVLS